MSSDYKYDIQMRAEELAENLDQDFYTMSPDQQYAIYQQATDAWVDSRCAAADALADLQRDSA